MSMGKPRDVAKERFWRQMVQQWQRSGLSVRAFCEHHGLEQHNFYAWQRTLRQRDAQTIAFVPVRLASAAESVRADASACALELVLGGCRRLRIAPGFDAATLQRLLAVLEEDQP